MVKHHQSQTSLSLSSFLRGKIFADLHRKQDSNDAGDDQNKQGFSWNIEIYTKVEEDEEGSSVQKKPFMGGQKQRRNSLMVVEAI